MKNREEILEDMLNSLENYEEAAEALSEFMHLNPSKAKAISLEILEHRKGDVYLRASAFDKLYALDRLLAYNYTLGSDDSMDIYLLGVIINNVTCDSPLQSEDSTITSFVKLLKQRISRLSMNDVSKIKEELDWFQQTYS